MIHAERLLEGDKNLLLLEVRKCEGDLGSVHIRRVLFAHFDTN